VPGGELRLGFFGKGARVAGGGGSRHEQRLNLPLLLQADEEQPAKDEH
jgi:hypothetical protein